MDDMMQGVLVSSGWAGLLGCMVLGGLAAPVLGAAGRRRAAGRSGTGALVAGLLLLAASVVAALSSWGSFFGLMGVAFAVFMCLGAWNAYRAPFRAQERLREQEAHAVRLGAAYARGAGSAAPPAAAPAPQAAPPGTSSAPPPWYVHDDGDRPPSPPAPTAAADGPDRPGGPR